METVGINRKKMVLLKRGKRQANTSSLQRGTRLLQRQDDDAHREKNMANGGEVLRLGKKEEQKEKNYPLSLRKRGRESCRKGPPPRERERSLSRKRDVMHHPEFKKRGGKKKKESGQWRRCRKEGGSVDHPQRLNKQQSAVAGEGKKTALRPSPGPLSLRGDFFGYRERFLFAIEGIAFLQPRAEKRTHSSRGLVVFLNGLLS